MSGKNPLSRRQFVAGASGLVFAGTVKGADKKTASKKGSKLAIDGGEKAVKSYPSLPLRWGEPEQERLDAMLKQSSLFYWKGPQTKLLMERFRKICPMKYVATCSSGTAALHIAVIASGIGLGDEVITSPVTDIGTIIGILYQQAVPVFADLGANTYNLDVADVERRITPKTKAIIPVHLSGNPCDMNAFRALADRHKLILIEDSCQAWGARYRGQPIGTVGDLTCHSLQNSKQVTCGDGGIVGSNDERFGPLLQKLCTKGCDRVKRDGFQSNMFATNYRMTEPQAAIAAAQLDRVESITSRRAHFGNLLSEKIAGIPGIEPHRVHPEDRATYYFYMFRMKPDAFRCDRRAFVKALVVEGVRAGAGYVRVPIYGEPAFQNHDFFAGHWPVKEMGLTDMDFTKHKCPEAEAILETGIKMTIHEAMTDEYILGAAAAIRKVASHYAV